MIEQNKQLELAIAALDKQFGKGSVMRPTDAPQDRPSISSGSLQLDRALGIGGFPTDGMVEVYGPESTGKTTLALAAIANAQKINDESCLFIDMEHALDIGYAQALGVDKDRFLFSQPEYGEQALEILHQTILTGGISVAVLDSVPACIPKAELEGSFEDMHMANVARLMASGAKKIAIAAQKSNTLVIFLNQVREKVGLVFGNPETTPGGHALRHAYLQRVALHRKGDIKDKEGNMVGLKVEAKVVKNKTAPPLIKAEYEITYGVGINQFGEVADMAIKLGLIQEPKKSRFEYKEHKIHGRDNVVAFLASDLDEFDILKKELENC